MKVTVSVDDAGLERIPREGPLIVVANHPLGAVDGLAMLEVIGRLRGDMKLIGNRLLNVLPGLRHQLISADVFGDRGINSACLRAACRWLDDGHAVGMFPAGEVSSFRLSRLQVADRPWSASLGWLARRCEAAVLPIWFDGGNGTLFHALGAIHPLLRTASLPRAALRSRGRPLTLRIGTPLFHSDLDATFSDEAFSQLVRARIQLLRHGQETTVVRGAAKPLAEPVDPALLEREVSGLGPDAILAESGDLVTLVGQAGQMPQILFEIARLREETFRQVGEGTGEPADRDRFDEHYLHLFVWNRVCKEVVGAYRLGLTDRILTHLGIDGLYTSTLFHYEQTLLDSISPAIELGRSFVRQEYQREYAPLLMLWKGIGKFVARNPRYKTLFGTVSISNEYKSISRELLMRFLLIHNRMTGVAGRVRPKNPPRFDFFRRRETHLTASSVRSVEEMDSLIAQIEGKQRGMPVLVRQYLRLGAKLLAFNVDPSFGNVLDGLVLVDLTRVEPALLSRYMGREGYQAFMATHQVKVNCESRAG